MLFLVFALFAVPAVPVQALSFKIATYNLENLFDMRTDRTEYPEYLPGNPLGWTSEIMTVKVNNMAAVIVDLDADIIALQEVESLNALKLLQDAVSRLGAPYAHAVIAEDPSTPVKCAVLSRFPIFSKKDIPTGNDGGRAILKVGVDIAGHPLIIYVSHWKSKTGPESRRLSSARALFADIVSLPPGTDFVLTGDFNSDYNEYETITESPKLNDTRGITGINHGLNTVWEGRLVDEAMLLSHDADLLLYNLWSELPSSGRWSVNFYGRKNTPDAILLPRSLYDGKGIAYVDNSFDKFDPAYLFNGGKVFRWQRSENGKGRHAGRGYSDHLPVFAEFTTAPFAWRPSGSPTLEAPTDVRIKDLYALEAGIVNVRLRDAAVIYKHRDNAVIKEKSGRAVYVYKAAAGLRPAEAYDLTVTELNRHYGNLEITGIRDILSKGPAQGMDGFYLRGSALDVSDPEFQNEVIFEIRGVYENGWLHYGDGLKIRIYFMEKGLAPDNFAPITLSGVRVGYHGHPEVIVEKPDQIR